MFGGDFGLPPGPVLEFIYLMSLMTKLTIHKTKVEGWLVVPRTDATATGKTTAPRARPDQSGAV